jgi:hypothetical protein
MAQPSQLVDRDEEHLRTLSICHYVFAALQGVGCCAFLVHIVMGVVFIGMGANSRGGAPPAFLGGLFVLIGLFGIALGLGSAALLYFAGRFLRERRHYTFCFVIAVLTCLAFPLGTVLGIFTLIVLSRPGVKASFDRYRAT